MMAMLLNAPEKRILINYSEVADLAEFTTSCMSCHYLYKPSFLYVGYK
jgi:hypothetical protein